LARKYDFSEVFNFLANFKAQSPNPLLAALFPVCDILGDCRVAGTPRETEEGHEEHCLKKINGNPCQLD
jgi:hypothetical protein